METITLNNQSELAHVERMKSKYGDEWYWYVENTEEEDCYLANIYREWFYKRGVHPDFNIHDQKNKEEEEKEDI